MNGIGSQSVKIQDGGRPPLWKF